ncbi:hypothetical protein SAMN05446927_0277 [Caballeronia arationis]|jgi:hypothetical protein|uniref:Uncharacterized protein n=1 Tax=Caballeronia arationis TaxID=1777142 RepID=A0A7Z7N0N8_9BURK|nr:hypothetical protein [Caballeronia arationis]SOE48237.1 hypothetical protein SAMN05446927_0277 [Caballeronia arationis]
MLTFDFTIVFRPSEALLQDTVKQMAAYCGLRFLASPVETPNSLTFVGRAEPSAVRTFAEIMLTVEGVQSVKIEPVTIN